jgi:hypothetical protein
VTSHDAEADRDPVVAMLKARVERLEQAVRDLDEGPETAEHAVVAAQLRAARRALADYETRE